jgi:hypothetical protein
VLYLRHDGRGGDEMGTDGAPRTEAGISPEAIRSVTRLHSDSLVETLELQVRMLKSCGRREAGGQHVGLERTIIGVCG